MTEEQIREARALCRLLADHAGFHAREAEKHTSFRSDDVFTRIDHEVVSDLMKDARSAIVAATDTLEGARSGALLLREEIDALRGMVEERDAEIELLRGLLAQAQETIAWLEDGGRTRSETSNRIQWPDPADQAVS